MSSLFGNGGDNGAAERAAQQAAQQARDEAARIKAQMEKEQADNANKLMVEKTSLAAKEAASKASRRQLLASAAFGDDTEDPLNPSTRKKKTGSLLSGVANPDLAGIQ